MTVENIRKWAERNKERVAEASLEYHKQWNKENRGKRNDIQRRYRIRNPDKTVVLARASRESRKRQWIEYLKTLKEMKCTICGYDRCLNAIDFHHIDPESKKVQISSYMYRRGLTEENKLFIKLEVEKCIVLCANCHREVHGKANQVEPESEPVC